MGTTEPVFTRSFCEHKYILLRKSNTMRSLRPITHIVSRVLGTGRLNCQHLSNSAVTRQVDTKIPPALWKLGNLNHVAIATPDLEKSTSLYRDILGAEVSDVVPLPEHGVYTVFVQLDNTKLELLYPLGDNSPIQN